ncbi:unnamed protein product [Mycetohabitans rhizoxinica HKI 454]|uniref:Uncharacterized protein n=1 Tax=Mycetohabitans rhizoxinica (strain DSM 19002 / CIP 109453 / HKI 454) TaxID=882378 RepID=E5APF3_MYCRK|nr:unnamed protein product [Mycetohabitans rhizoxinica HKI 454]
MMTQMSIASSRLRPHRTHVALKRAKLVYFALAVRCDGENALRWDWVAPHKPLSRLRVLRFAEHNP